MILCKDANVLPDPALRLEHSGHEIKSLFHREGSKSTKKISVHLVRQESLAELAI
jgi:hypothetical protein